MRRMLLAVRGEYALARQLFKTLGYTLESQMKSIHDLCIRRLQALVYRVTDLFQLSLC
jgi:hypothetical protein